MGVDRPLVVWMTQVSTKLATAALPTDPIAAVDRDRSRGTTVVPISRAMPVRALVAAVRSGQRDAETELFDRVAPAVTRVLGRILGRDAELADLVQEVFLRLFARLDQLVEPERVWAFALTIAVHVARERIRKKHRWRWIRLGRAEDREPSRGESQEAARLLGLAYEALSELPEEERIAFCLRFIDGMDLSEIAVVMGLSLATVKRRLVRARELFHAAAEKRPALAAFGESLR